MRGSTAALQHPDCLYIGGEWVQPDSDARIDVTDCSTEERFLTVAEATESDLSRAVAAARDAFDNGPWPRLGHSERAQYLEALAAGLRERTEDEAQMWPRESGVLYSHAQRAANRTAATFEYYATMAKSFSFEEPAQPTGAGQFGLLVREPVGVVVAIIPWNAPLTLIGYKVAPALLAGCTVILKSSPEAPGEGYLLAEVASSVGLPPGVLNVVTADRAASDSLVRDPGVDKITFTGSTVTGRRIASVCGERIARCTLELGGKSAAVVLDDIDLDETAETLARAECHLTGQACASLTRVVVTRDRHDELVEALKSSFSQVRVGDPFDPNTEMGPLATSRQLQRVEGFIEKGLSEGAVLATGGGRPKDLDRGWYIEPTVFGHVDNSSAIAQNEIFGPVLAVIPATSEQNAIDIANDTIYGLNASVFTNDVNRARDVACQLRSGTVGHNGPRGDFGIAFGGFKQSGLGREGGVEGLHPFLETKTIILEGRPKGYEQHHW